ncbi:efflux RND transporter periplasmic adaptor subunit [Rubritalea tangerina]|uniref:Efflux RND transporter periplasmic adaptor subunit n=1 Tax=Rubritalea tangerina TaxID=430798 RepID=A0ABW4Z9T0_9BACT
MNRIFKTTLLLVSFISPLFAKQSIDASKTIILTEQGVQNLGITTEKVKKASFEDSVFAIGHIQPIPSKHAVISTRFAGRVVQTPPIVGDFVQKGDVLLKVESRQPGSPPPVIDVKAPETGIISQSHVTLGQPVDPSQELMDIVDLRQVWAVASVPESQASKLKLGTTAHIKVISLGNTTFDGQLIRMGSEANHESGTLEAIFLLDNPDLKLRPNMRTEFSIVLNQRKDVISVPRKALQGDAATPYVFVKHYDLPNAFDKSPVVVGERNDRFVEIKSGISRFDEVVTNGAYFLGFAQGGGISLKEALDAAHGHEHNEDGSEMTPAQKAAREAQKNAASPTQAITWRSPLVIFLIASNCITLALLTVITLKKSSKPC